jgi:hypothetical protein
MTTENHTAAKSQGESTSKERVGAKNLALLRLIAHGFIWLGTVACGAYLLLALPNVSSFSSLLLTVIDTIGRLSATVGLGAILLALAEIADGLRSPGRKADQQEKSHT